ncbi:GMC oxidoreductase [Pleionea sediminis]|uniref:GMC oxidoreductase n=1 Tax=Pleionea sediminis TaxID=2569479 RepID=UPI001185C67B|nr:GMC oxidoreductase [Pleionea sediminis]
MTKKNKCDLSKLSRRQLIKMGGITGLGLATPLTHAALFPRERPTEEKDIVIIGSGFGGAVSAMRLTQAGRAVTLVEKGRRWDGPIQGDSRFSKNLYPDRRSTWLSNTTVIPIGPPLPIRRYTGVLQGRDMAGFRILSGAAYGGGSIVYGGILKKPEEAVFNQVFPREVSFTELQPFYQEVAQRLSRSTLPPEIEATDYFKHVRLCREHCERANIDWEPIETASYWDRVEREISGDIAPSSIHGEAVYGVNSGAKATLDNTYLKEAEQTGLLEVKTLHEIESIEHLPDGRYLLDYKIINTRGATEATGKIITRHLILSAGTMGTNELLVAAKAKGKLPLLNEDVGEGFGNNGNVYGLRLGLESTGRWQGGPPSIGIRDYNNDITPLFIEHPQLPLGIDIRGLLYFGVGITPTRGRFTYNAWRRKVELEWPRIDPGQARVNQALLANLDRLNEVNGGFNSRLLDNFRSETKDDSIYHPLGGCVLGKACDFYGRVKNYPGLYVNDGSMMPGSSACTNPSFTIAAIAERNIDHLLKTDFI